MRSLDRKLWRDLSHWRGQVIAIALVVACGIASFVSMLSAYDSLLLSQETYYDRYRFAQVFVQLKRAPESLLEPIRQLPGVAQVRSRVVVDVTLDVPGLDEPATGRLISIPERRRPMLNDLFIRQGRYIEPGHSDEVLVSEAFAEANQLQLGDELGAVINGRWQTLRLVGIALSPEYIYEIRGTGDILPDNQRFGVLWMGREALGTAFNMDGAFNDLSLTLTRGASEAAVIFRLDQLLDAYGGLGAYGREDQLSHRFLSDEIASLQGTATTVPVIFLGIAAFLLHMLLSRLVGTQRDQIAVLKAFGYGNWTIGQHYLKFVGFVVTIGAGLGTLVGLWFGLAVTQNYAQFYRFPVLQYEAKPAMVLGAIAISAGAALIGAVTTVRKAVSLPPAEAMRPEPPAQFRRTVMERLGLQQLLPPVWRIILRNLERKPIQGLLASLGIALAIAMLVVGRYFTDAIQAIVDVQFRTVQREDVTIVFNEPRPNRVRYEIDHLPGVLQSEGFRSVPARLRYGHRTYRSGLTGLEPGASLRRLLDQDLQRVYLPPAGVLLTRQLADILHIERGDRLTVEVLEGRRPTRTVPVVGLVDELIGLGAYMDIRALHQLMQEDFTLSGAYLQVDGQQMETLYQQLKRTPAVAGVSIRATAIQRFQATIASSLDIFTSVLVIFSCIIAFGVVYNAARIALSERGRELATLRIIGFTQAEIAIVLLGEQAILLVLAIPVGFLLGFGLSALISAITPSELYRIPLVVTPATYAFAFVVITLAAIASGWIVRRQLNQLDLIAVLKTRE